MWENENLENSIKDLLKCVMFIQLPLFAPTVGNSEQTVFSAFLHKILVCIQAFPLIA